MSPTRPDRFVRLAQVVGDFGNPFYAEERQRDVWNEASAFGLQLAIWTSLLTATAVLWRVGAPSVPYVSGGLALLGAVCWLTIAYASRLGVTLAGVERLLRWSRLLPLLVLMAALFGGYLHATSEQLSSSTTAGLLTGAVVGAGLAAFGLRRPSRA